MAFQRIRIKNTNVVGKIPGADKIDVAELCINLKDQKLYSKDADGNVFELGKTAVNNGPIPPISGNEIGDLWWDGSNLLVWNGSDWEIVGAKELGDLDDVEVGGVTDKQVLIYDAESGNWVPANAAELAVDVDLDYTPAADKGTITNTAGDDAELPLVDETNAGLMSPAEHKKLGDMPVIISGPDFDQTPSLGDIWFDTSDCPPTINIWDDCDDPGNPIWRPIGGGELPGCQQGAVQIIGDNEIGSTLTATGGNGIDEGTQLTATYSWLGPNGFTATGNSIVATEEGDYTVTAEITCTDGSTLSTSATKTIVDSYVDMVNNTPPVIAVVGEGPDGAYEGNSIYVVTPATVINGDSPVIVENQWFKDGAAAGTSQLYGITAADAVGAVITCKQLFRDARTNEILSDASNGITIVARPAGAITFVAVITDDGTEQGNTVGRVLTASALNIQGGIDPVEFGYEWLVGGLTMGTNKTLNLVQSFVGQVVICNVTVAERDTGENPETRPATYDKIIEVAGAINTPTVIAPLNGDDYSQIETRNLISDSIIDIDGGGVDTCETKLIQTVESAGAPLVWEEGDGKVSFTDVDLTTWLASNNITSIKGFRMELFENTRGSEIRSFKINGTDLAGSNIAVASESGSWYSTATPGNWLNGIGAAVQNENGESQFTFAEQAITGTVTVTVTDANGDIYLIAGDDKEYSLMGSAAVKLTFPDTTGFDCFEVGDVVQGDAFSNAYAANYFFANANADPTKVPTKTSTLVTNGANAFDGNTATNATNVSSPGDGYWLDFPVPFKASSVGLWSTTGGDHDMKAVVYDDLGNEVAQTFPQGGQQFRDVDTSSLLGKITSVVWWMPTNKITAWAYRVTANGTQDFLTEGTPSEVKVVSKDPDAVPPTITVDGGDWSDAPSDPGTNQDDVWSKYLTSSNGWADPNYQSDKAFDGGTSGTWAASGNSGKLTVVLPVSVSNGDTVSIYEQSSYNGRLVTVNGDTVQTNVTQNDFNITEDSDSLTVVVDAKNQSGSATLCAIQLNGITYVDAAGQRKLSKETPYDAKLTVASDKDLADFPVGEAMVMSDGTPADGPFTLEPYKLVTTDIESVESVSTWNQDQNWSAAVTHSDLDPGLPFARGFDGNPETATGALRYNTLTLNFGNSFNVNPVKLEVVTADGRTVYVDGDEKGSADSSNTPSTVNCGTVAFSEIEISTDPVNTNGGAFWSIKINNQELVDQNVTGAPTMPKLVFPGDVSTNPDLQYFKTGDIVQEYESTTIQTYKGYAKNDSDENLAISSLTYVGEETFGVKPTSGPGGQTQLAYEFTRPLENVEIGHFSTNSPVLDLYGSDTGLVNSWTFILNIDNRTQSALSGDRPYKYLKIVRTDAPGSVDYRNYGILESYVPLIKVHVISTGILDGTNSNTMVVDGGTWSGLDGSGIASWNQDEEWTEAPIFNDTGRAPYPGRDVINAFDGTIGTSAADGAMPNSGLWKWAFTGFDDAKTVELFGSSRTAGGQNQLNGVAFDEVTYANPLTIDVEGTGLQNLQISGDYGNNYHMVLTGIKVDGRLLVNPGISGSPSGDSHVEYQTNGGKGTIISTDTTDNTILLSDAADATRDNRWIKGTVDSDGNAGNSGETGNAAGAVDFYAAGGQKSDDPTLTADIRLQCSEFATTPENVDTLKNIVWEIRNNDTNATEEQDAGTVNPYKPNPALQTGTSYTVRAKHQGNDLDDSAYSNSTTFKTGATRNIREYYQEKIEVLQSRIASIEADEVNDDATDTALLNLLANLVQRVDALEGGG